MAKFIINNELSENIRKYIQTGKVEENYYQYCVYNCCTDRINKEFNMLLNDCRDNLLYFLNDKKRCKEYSTQDGIIREVCLFSVWEYKHYWEHEERISRDSSLGNYRIHIYAGSTGAEYWKRMLKNNGFITKEYDKKLMDDYGWHSYHIYAYIKL